jgi:hypothetical protein
VVQDLRHGQELADRGAGLDRQRGEVDAQRLHFGQQLAQARDRALAGNVERAFRVDPAAQGVVKLRGIDPEVDPPHAQAIRAHGARQRRQAHRHVAIFGSGGIGFQRGNQRRQAEQLGRIVGRQAVGRRCQSLGRIERARKQLGHFRSMGLRRIERGDQRVIGHQAGKPRRIGGQPARLFAQAECDRGVPADIGAAIHVIADPGGKAERQRPEIEPAARPALAGMGQQRGVDAVARMAGTLDRVAHFKVLEFQGDLGAVGRQGTHRGGQRIVGQRGRGYGIGLRRIEQERGVRGEHRMQQRLFPAGAELAEAVFLVQQGGHARQVLVGIGRRHQPAQAPGTALQRLALQLGHQAFHVVERQGTGLQLAREIVAELEYRIEQRRFGGPLVQLAQTVPELCDGLHLPFPLLAVMPFAAFWSSARSWPPPRVARSGLGEGRGLARQALDLGFVGCALGHDPATPTQSTRSNASHSGAVAALIRPWGRNAPDRTARPGP